jgi:pimeloyl-ACP methyl ester carboxylesterase
MMLRRTTRSSHTARSGRAELAYEVTAPAESAGPATAARPPVLLLHAGVTDRRSWAPLVEALGRDRTTVAYDRRGFGDTRSEPEPFSPVDDALAVLGAALPDHGTRPVAVVGASMGGRVALDLALAHPERVAALVLIGPAVRGAPGADVDTMTEAERRLDEALEAADGAGDLAEVNRIEAHVWLDGPEAPEGRVSGPTRDLFLAMNGRALAAEANGEAGDETAAEAAWGRLAQIVAPTLVLVGDGDLAHVRARAGETADRIPGARLEVLVGTAHLPHLEAHPRCLAAIGEALAGTR